ncbi:hypothetical protein DOY81_008635 [Sarcophaga bullata]|nr:hypothetical protein DOY81_008635 [Sarcophaga bullata]
MKSGSDGENYVRIVQKNSLCFGNFFNDGIAYLELMAKLSNTKSTIKMLGHNGKHGHMFFQYY